MPLSLLSQLSYLVLTLNDLLCPHFLSPNSSLNNRSFASIKRQYNADNDHHPQDTLLEILIHTHNVHAILQYTHDERAEQRVYRPSGPSGERRTSDHDGGDRTQYVR